MKIKLIIIGLAISLMSTKCAEKPVGSLGPYLSLLTTMTSPGYNKFSIEELGIL